MLTHSLGPAISHPSQRWQCHILGGGSIPGGDRRDDSRACPPTACACWKRPLSSPTHRAGRRGGMDVQPGRWQYPRTGLSPSRAGLATASSLPVPPPLCQLLCGLESCHHTNPSCGFLCLLKSMLDRAIPVPLWVDEVQLEGGAMSRRQSSAHRGPTSAALPQGTVTATQH